MNPGIALRPPGEGEAVLEVEAARALSAIERCTSLAEGLQQREAGRLGAATLASLRDGARDPSEEILASMRRMETIRRVTTSASALLRPLVPAGLAADRVQTEMPAGAEWAADLVDPPLRVRAARGEGEEAMAPDIIGVGVQMPADRRVRDLPLFRYQEDRSLRLYEVAGMRISALDMGPGRFIVLPGSDFDLAPRRALSPEVIADRKAAVSAILPREGHTATFILPHAFESEKTALAAVLPGHDAGLQPRRINLFAMTATCRDRAGPDEGYRRVRSNMLDEALETLAPDGKRVGPSRQESRKARIFFSKSEKGMFQVRKEHLTWAIGAARKEAFCLFLFGVEGYAVVPVRQVLDLIAGDWLIRTDRGGDAYRFLYGDRDPDGTAIFHLGAGRTERIGPLEILRA